MSKKYIQRQKNDELGDLILDLKPEDILPRTNLSEKDKDELIKKVGGHKTTKAILRAKKDFPLSRIPWIFNSLDTQAIVDILNNDLTEALKRAENSLNKA